ncbi:MAG: bis(5'-nucleosyl)-tetraphosphatase (symmetrical) YqeK [Syntrophothermus sp.]
MEEEKLVEKVKEILSSERLAHTLGVVQTARMLSEKYGADSGKAVIAALLHDIARDHDRNTLLQMVRNFGIVIDEVSAAQPELLHQLVGAELARRDFGITDPAIINAIRIHTTGSVRMSLLDKIVYLADFIEPGRDFPGVEQIRKKAWEDLDEGLLASTVNTIRYLLEKGKLIHTSTVALYNELQLIKSRQE